MYLISFRRIKKDCGDLGYALRGRKKFCMNDSKNALACREKDCPKLKGLKKVTREITTGWNNIETAPKNGEPVLIKTSYNKMATAYWGGTTWVDWMRSSHTYGSVTHWKSLGLNRSNKWD